MQTNAQLRVYSAGIYLFKGSNIILEQGAKSVQS